MKVPTKTLNFKMFSSVLILLLLASFIAPLSLAAAGGQNGQGSQYGTTNNDAGTSGGITTVANNSGATQGGQTDSSGNTATATPYSNLGADGNGGNGDSNTSSFGPSETGSSGSEKQYNKPDVTPKGETEQIRAREQTIFQY